MREVGEQYVLAEILKAKRLSYSFAESGLPCDTKFRLGVPPDVARHFSHQWYLYHLHQIYGKFFYQIFVFARPESDLLPPTAARF